MENGNTDKAVPVQWEYAVDVIPIHVAASLSERGLAGWELVSVVTIPAYREFYFKRAKADQ